jgi:hypothetical protein
VGTACAAEAARGVAGFGIPAYTGILPLSGANHPVPTTLVRVARCCAQLRTTSAPRRSEIVPRSRRCAVFGKLQCGLT